MRKGKLDRRRFLGSALAASTVTACSRKVAPRFLSDAEMATLAAICDQMVPPDQDPGGGWAGAANYIARQLRGPFRDNFDTYRQGLAEADRRAGGSFSSLPREQQLDLLNRMDRDPATKGFMSLAAAHSIQGYYGNPRHGGNRDYCSWRMLGVATSPVRGRDQYDFTRGGKT